MASLEVLDCFITACFSQQTRKQEGISQIQGKPLQSQQEQSVRGYMSF